MTDYNSIYLPLQTINVPQDNDAHLVFDYVDENGALLDTTGIQEIEFVVFTDIDGTAEISKTLTLGDIVLFGNDYQFGVYVTAAETQALTNRRSYHECQVTNSAGLKRTVSAGLFRAEKTYIWSNT